MTETPPQLVMLCGIPTSGKSSYVCQGLDETDCFDGYVVLSTDTYIEYKAVENSISYNEAFEEFIEPAQKHLDEQLDRATCENKSIVWDQTNLTSKVRKRKLSRIPAHYRKVVVWFDISLEEAMIRNRKRPGKVIPGSVLKRMFHTFSPPTEAEGFDQIIKGN